MIRTNIRLGFLVAAALLPASLWSATIGGTVVASGTTTALANASVVLSAPGTAGGPRTPLDTAQTDAAGAFSFTVPAGQNYGVSVNLAGYLPYANINVDLAADTSAAQLAISLSPVPPPADIAGIVRNAVDTSAVAGAAVVLSRAGTGGGGPRVPLDTATTDAQGRFSFPDLAAADNYGLAVTAAGFSAYANNNIDLEGRDTSITINLLPPADINGTLLGGADAAAPPVAGATVILSRPGTGGGGGGARVPVDTAATDAQGKFSFADLASMDNYGISITAAGFGPYSNNNIDLRGRDTSITINLAGPADINGTVFTPDSTTAVAGATVVLSRPGTGGAGGGARTPVDTATTDAQGKFSFPDLVSMDNYGISIIAAGFDAYSNNNIDLRGRDTSVTAVLELPPPPGTISGTVRGPGGATGALIANATVVLSRPGTGGGGGGFARIPVDTVQTSAQGAFTFADVPAGDNYGLSITAAGFNTYANNNVDLDGGDTTTVNVNLTVAASIRPHGLQARGFDASWTPDGLALSLPPEAGIRGLSVFALSGALRHQAPVPTGAVRMLLPAEALQERGLFLTLEGPGWRETMRLPRR